MSGDSEFFGVNNNDGLPSMDSNFVGSSGYNSINELMRAIILRVVEDIQSNSEHRNDALAYLWAKDEEDQDDYIFSFCAICRHLGFDPEKTRDAILNPAQRISTRRRAA